MMDGNYLWYRDHGFGPDEDVAAWIREQLGGDSRVDDTVADGETLRLGADLSVEVLHLPWPHRGPRRPVGRRAPGGADRGRGPRTRRPRPGGHPAHPAADL
jgi:hypothetical protein